MSIALTLVALSLVGGEPKPVEPPQTSLEVRVMEIPAAPWRKDIYKNCKRIGREGISTLWTIDDTSMKQLAALCDSTVTAKTILAPKVTAFDGDTATVTAKQNRFLVTDVDIVKNGEPGVVQAAAFHPVTDQIEEGVDVSFKVRRLGASTELTLDLASIWIAAVNEAKVTETVSNKQFGVTDLNSGVQLPQLVEARVEGVYNIPTEGHLLVSLGSAMVTPEKGQPVLMERLAMISPRRIIPEAEEARIAVAPRKLPMLPARSMPTAVSPNGQPVLLADPNVKATSFEPVTVPAPRASAQASTPSIKTEAPYPSADLRLDPNVTVAGFEPAPAAPSTLNPKPEVAKPGTGFTFPTRFSIEIKINIGK